MNRMAMAVAAAILLLVGGTSAAPVAPQRPELQDPFISCISWRVMLPPDDGVDDDVGVILGFVHGSGLEGGTVVLDGETRPTKSYGDTLLCTGLPADLAEGNHTMSVTNGTGTSDEVVVEVRQPTLQEMHDALACVIDAVIDAQTAASVFPTHGGFKSVVNMLQIALEKIPSNPTIADKKIRDAMDLIEVHSADATFEAEADSALTEICTALKLPRLPCNITIQIVSQYHTPDDAIKNQVEQDSSGLIEVIKTITTRSIGCSVAHSILKYEGEGKKTFGGTTASLFSAFLKKSQSDTTITLIHTPGDSGCTAAWTWSDRTFSTGGSGGLIVEGKDGFFGGDFGIAMGSRGKGDGPNFELLDFDIVVAHDDDEELLDNLKNDPIGASEGYEFDLWFKDFFDGTPVLPDEQPKDTGDVEKTATGNHTNNQLEIKLIAQVHAAIGLELNADDEFASVDGRGQNRHALQLEGGCDNCTIVVDLLGSTAKVTRTIEGKVENFNLTAPPAADEPQPGNLKGGFGPWVKRGQQE